MMVSARAKPAEMADDDAGARGVGAITRIGDDADEAVLRDRARGPAGGAVVREPVMRQFVVDVIGVEQRHQHVDVEQGDAGHWCRLRLVAQIVDELHGRARRPGRTAGQERHAVADPAGLGRLEPLARQL